MKRRLLALAALAVAATAVAAADEKADEKDDANKKDLKALQGTWKVEKAVRGGEEAPAGEIEKGKFVFEGNKFIIDEGRPKKETATFTLDATQKPKAIDLTFGMVKEAVLGIYEVDGDTLKICFGGPGKDRPKKMESEKGSGLLLVVLKRQKK
jgi:uncharacterized protein (TIGR03067 family)